MVKDKRNESAGHAFLRAISKDPKAQAAFQRTKLRMASMAAAVRAMGPMLGSTQFLGSALSDLRKLADKSPELQRLEVERQKAFKELDKVLKATKRARAAKLSRHIKASMKSANENLQEAGFDPPGKERESWEHLARIVEKNPSLMTYREIYQWALAWADRQRIAASLSQKADSPARRPAGRVEESQQEQGVLLANEARDAWLYEQCCQGTSYKRILSQLRAKPDWEHLANHQSVTAAVKRYVVRHGLSLPPRRKGGRPRRGK